MAGIHEIFILIVIGLAILILPRLLSRGKNREFAIPAARRTWPVLSGWMRLAVVASALWPLVSALVLKPWEGDFLPFVCIGPAPVLVAWCAWWVKKGFRRRHRR